MRTQNTLGTFRIEFMQPIVVCLTALCYTINQQSHYSGYHSTRNARNYSWVGDWMKISNVLLVADITLMLYYTVTGAQILAIILIIMIPIIMNINN